MNRASLTLRGGGPTGQRSVRKAIPGVPYWFDYYGTTQTTRFISGSMDSTTTIDDIVYDVSSGATSAIDFTPLLTGTLPTMSVLSGTSIEIDGPTLKSVGSGDTVIRYQSAGRTLDQTYTATYTVDGAAQTFKQWATGSLAQVASDTVDDGIAGDTPSTAKLIFTTQNHSTSTYVRNTGIWCPDLAAQLTCASPWNSYNAQFRAGTLLTDRHIVFSNHYPIPDGTTIRFIGSDNTVYNYTLLKSAPSNSGDFRIGVLNTTVNAAIHRCKVFPSDVASRLPNLAHGVPTIVLDQEEKALVADWYSSTGVNGYAYYRKPTDPTRLSFYEAIVGGDSGNPTFLAVGTDLVFLSVWHYSDLSNWSSGPFSGSNITALNAAIATADAAAGISTGLTVTPYDLSSYPTY